MKCVGQAKGFPCFFLPRRGFCLHGGKPNQIKKAVPKKLSHGDALCITVAQLAKSSFLPVVLLLLYLFDHFQHPTGAIRRGSLAQRFLQLLPIRP